MIFELSLTSSLRCTRYGSQQSRERITGDPATNCSPARPSLKKYLANRIWDVCINSFLRVKAWLHWALWRLGGTPRRAGKFIGISFLRCGDRDNGPSLESRESSVKSARACSAGGRTVSPGKSHAQKNSMLKVTLQISRVCYQLGISEHLLPLSLLPHNPTSK